MAIELKPHQLKALEEMKNGCILKGGVGTGKSLTALAYFFTKECGGSLKINGFGGFESPPKPKDLYIITTAKKRDDLDWEREASHFALSTDPSLSAGGIKVTVDGWNNILKYTEVENAHFIFDEQRLVGAGAWVKAFYKIAERNSWGILSATPGDQWMDYAPVFIANGYYKNRTEFLREHVVYKPFTKFPSISHYVNTQALERLRYRLIVEMPFEKHTVRHVKQVLVDHNKALMERVTKDRWHIYEDRPIKDVGELFAVMRKLVNSDPSRIGELMVLLEKHPKLIVFYNFNYELDALRTIANTLSYPVAEWNGHKHQPIPKDDKWLYLVQYTSGSEGWNCIETDAILFYSLNYSWRINEQSRGRTDRMNTPFVDLYYYLLASDSMIDKAILKAIRTKKNFNEKEYESAW